MVLDYKILNLENNKGLFNPTAPCDLCATAACVNSKAAFFSWIKYSKKDDNFIFSKDKKCEDICFKNFPNLFIKDKDIKNCTFENCGNITAEGCRMNGCKFNNVNNIKGIRTAFDSCEFINCCSDGPFLVIDTLGFIDGCTFDTITALGNNGYIIYSVYRKNTEVEQVTNCKFFDCQIESKDGKYCYCAYLKRSYLLKPVEIDNVDYNTCDFTDDEGEAIEIGSFNL